MANTSDEMRQYREAFSLFDKDHDEIIAPQELGKRDFVIFILNSRLITLYLIK